MTEQEIMNLSRHELDNAVLEIEKRKEDKYYYRPTTNGNQCMEIMERERIDCVVVFCNDGIKWKATNNKCTVTGKTPQEAIMRCFLLSKQQ